MIEHLASEDRYSPRSQESEGVTGAWHLLSPNAETIAFPRDNSHQIRLTTFDVSPAAASRNLSATYPIQSERRAMLDKRWSAITSPPHVITDPQIHLSAFACSFCASSISLGFFDRDVSSTTLLGLSGFPDIHQSGPNSVSQLCVLRDRTNADNIHVQSRDLDFLII